MFYGIFMVKVEDYDKFLSIIKEDESLIKSFDGKSAQVLQVLDNPNMGIVIVKWENLENAKKFVESEELKARMQAGGVSGKPEIYFAEEKLILF
jgi:heme-degrading monooxygenase HmoA